MMTNGSWGSMYRLSRLPYFRALTLTAGSRNVAGRFMEEGEDYVGWFGRCGLAASIIGGWRVSNKKMDGVLWIA